MRLYLMLLPMLIYIVLMDVHIITAAYYYETVAYSSMTNRMRLMVLIISCMGLFATILVYIAAVMTYDNDHVKYSDWLALVLQLKAFLWSPFIAFEYYDTFFEHLYFDVAY